MAVAVLLSLAVPASVASAVSERAHIVEIVRNAAEVHDVPSNLAVRVAMAESSLNPYAEHVNADGSRDLGLMQLNERYLPYFAKRFNGGIPISVFDPEQNANTAFAYLRALYEFTGNWEDAIAAYNCGLSRVLAGKVPESTARYVKRIVRKETPVKVAPSGKAELIATKTEQPKWVKYLLGKREIGSQEFHIYLVPSEIAKRARVKGSEIMSDDRWQRLLEQVIGHRGEKTGLRRA